jgi:ribosomal protein S18 acetylase RimI-like enzyme
VPPGDMHGSHGAGHNRLKANPCGAGPTGPACSLEAPGRFLICHLGVSDEGFFVDNVAVDPSHQGVGVGKALLEHAESAARHAGFDSIYLYTHERTVENLALYSRLGYVEYDRRLLGNARLVYLRKSLG